MSLHTDLSIYKTAYDLYGQAVAAVRNMPRDFKDVVGKPLVDRCLSITTLVRQTNAADLGDARLVPLTAILDRVQEAETMLRTSVEQRCISRGKYAELIQLTQSIGRQANGWRKASSNTPDSRAPRRTGQRDLQPGRAAAP